LLSLAALGQSDFNLVFSEAENNYNKKNYNKALVLFFKADSLSRHNPEVSYWIGKCYHKIKGKELSALPFYEHALKMKKIPVNLHKDLGTLYHQTFVFDKAIQQFSQYVKKAGATGEFTDYCKRMIEWCNNAKFAADKKSSKKIQLLPLVINSGYSEYAPYISADLKTMVFTRLELNEEENILNKYFFITTSSNGGIIWENIEQINIPAVFNIDNVELAGISFDGQTIYLSIIEETTASLYSAAIRNNMFEDITKFETNINSSYNEYSISFSADGTSCIFSSDRVGGFGGIDLYKSTLNPDGTWTLPVNLGPNINTKYNENNPFLHPSGLKLIFASEGHNSIGGYDLLESNMKENGFWTKPVRIDYANTVYDDCYYMIDAKGSKSFFSQGVNFYPDRNKIYSAELSDNIPLTMLEGIIKAGNPPKPHPTDIKVYDHVTRQKIKYVYCPNKYTGRYLMIFPPGKNYDIVIEAEGFLPYLINIHIPEQKYFYELYQELILESIEENNRRIGENIIVRNTFYDIYQTTLLDSISDIFGEIAKDKTQQLQFIRDVVHMTDSIHVDNMIMGNIKTERNIKDKLHHDKLFNLIGNAIENTDSLSLLLIDENTLYDEIIVKPTYYPQDEPQKALVMSIYDTDTVYSTPLVSITDNRRIQVPLISATKDSIQFNRQYNINRQYLFTDTVFFNVNSSLIEPFNRTTLNYIAKRLLRNPNLGAELFGYSDSRGGVEYNLILSEQRARAVLNYLSKLKVQDYRFIVVPCGIDKSFSSENQEIDSEKLRRVEIKVFEIY